ncbi:MAG: YIP1 family protein [Prolixibacteraceae bacterium]|nr:YIP1 family protein [Prolixibacteraceae bacterium]
MINYLKLIVFPSKTLDELNDERPSQITQYLIITFGAIVGILPKYLAGSITSSKGSDELIFFLAGSPFIFFPIVYGIGYFYWKICNGFKGTASLIEVRTLLVYSFLPNILGAFLTIPFIIVGMIRNNVEIITHQNPLTNLFLWFLGFRILMVGIAKYNKFNWMITLIVHLIVVSVLGGLAYLFLSLRQNIQLPA